MRKTPVKILIVTETRRYLILSSFPRAGLVIRILIPITKQTVVISEGTRNAITVLGKLKGTAGRRKVNQNAHQY